MITREFISGVSPFNDGAHDIQLSLSICKGERPEITKIAPECYVNLMKKCWDSDPLKRPTASEVSDIISCWSVGVSKYYKDDKPDIDHEIIKENIDEIIKEGVYRNGNDIKEFWRVDKALAQEYVNSSTSAITENINSNLVR